MDDIVTADKRYRTRLFVAYGAGLCTVALLLWLGLPRFVRHLNTLPVLAFINVAEICVVAFLLAFVVPAGFLIHTGRKVLHYKEMPYPGMRVIRDTKVVRGKKAMLRGRLLLILGIAAICIAVAGIVRSHYYFEKFRHFSPFHATNAIVERTGGKPIDRRPAFVSSFAAPETHVGIRA
jgi:hypothetical protein